MLVAKEGERFAIGEVNNTQVGVPPLSHKAFSNRLSAFSFGRRSAKEKAWQKEKRVSEISPSAEGDQRSARWISGRFLKKAT